MPLSDWKIKWEKVDACGCEEGEAKFPCPSCYHGPLIPTHCCHHILGDSVRLPKCPDCEATYDIEFKDEGYRSVEREDEEGI